MLDVLGCHRLLLDVMHMDTKAAVRAMAVSIAATAACVWVQNGLLVGDNMMRVSRDGEHDRTPKCTPLALKTNTTGNPTACNIILLIPSS